MIVWGDPVVLWSDAVVELWRWRRQRKQAARAATRLVADIEAYLAAASAPPIA